MLLLECLTSVLRVASVVEIQLSHFIECAGKKGSNLVDLHEREVVHTKPFVIEHC